MENNRPGDSALYHIINEGLVIRVGVVGCIESTAKYVHKELMKTIFQANRAEPRLEDALELLGSFLEQEDFKKLRAVDPDIAGQREVSVRIYRGPEKVEWRKLK